MMIAAIMCGGKGSRMGQLMNNEKPLLKLKGKALIEHVLDALVESKKFRRIIGVSSTNTPKTSAFLHYCTAGQVDVIETEGISYSKDLSMVLNKLEPARFFIVPADLPLLNAKVVGKVIRCLPDLPCVSIVIEKRLVEEIGIKPSVVFNTAGKECCYSGILILDSSKFKDGHSLEEYYIVMNEKEVAVNVNTKEELQLAERLFCSI